MWCLCPGKIPILYLIFLLSYIIFVRKLIMGNQQISFDSSLTCHYLDALIFLSLNVYSDFIINYFISDSFFILIEKTIRILDKISAFRLGCIQTDGKQNKDRRISSEVLLLFGPYHYPYILPPLNCSHYFPVTSSI